MIQTFWLERTDELAIGLRRYNRGSAGFTCETGFHQALVYIDRAPIVLTERGTIAQGADTPHDDPRWPTHCVCGYEFTAADEFQTWQEAVWRRTDTGQERFLQRRRDTDITPVPVTEPGACWDAAWMPDDWKVDGIYLMVRCPDGHDWSVDSRASNCTLPDDTVHKCWVRHGDPRQCRVTVDKNGNTCSAGAGSILTPNWHGFLRDGQLVE